MVAQGIAVKGGRYLRDQGRVLRAQGADCADCCEVDCICTGSVCTTVGSGPQLVTTPAVDLTLSWLDAAVTKNYLGLVWTNGETKAVCGYALCERSQGCVPPSPCNTATCCFLAEREQFYNGVGAYGSRLIMSAFFSPSCIGGEPPTNYFQYSDVLHFRGIGPTSQAILRLRRFQSPFGGSSNTSTRTNISTDNFGTALTNFTIADGFVENSSFGQVTDTLGNTYTWQRSVSCPSWPIC